jgi:HEAT repeat protein
LRYAARPIDADAVRAAVLAMANDSDWYVRARLAEAMRWFVLDDATMPSAMMLLNDSHWLVRSLARRLLADQHGNKFGKILEMAAHSDPDAWARQLAGALLERQRQADAAARQAQSQPAREISPS